MKRRGSSLLETAMFVPVLILLLVGMAEIGRVTYVYYTLHKTLYNVARLVGTRPGANLCDAGDAEVLSAKNWAVSGAGDGSGQPILNNLTAELISIRVERQEPDSDFLGECECSLSGCDIGAGGRSPDFVVASIPDGFPVSITIPYLTVQTVVFRPTVRVPFGGS